MGPFFETKHVDVFHLGFADSEPVAKPWHVLKSVGTPSVHTLVSARARSSRSALRAQGSRREIPCHGEHWTRLVAGTMARSSAKQESEGKDERPGS